MTTAPSRTGEVIFKAETTANAEIASAATYWADAPKALRAWDADVTQLKYTSERDPSLQPRAFAHPANLLLTKGGTFPFKTHLHGLNAAGAAGTAVEQDNLGLLLKTALGGENLGTTRAVNTGSSTTTTVLVAATTGLVVGGAVMINGEARIIKTVDANTSIVLDMALSAAPNPGDLIKAAATYYIDESALVDLADSDHDTLAVLFRGYHSEDQWQMRGAFPQIELANLGPGKSPHLQVTMHPQDWELVTGVAAGTAPTERAPAVQKGGGFYYGTVGATTKNVPTVKSIDIKLGLTPEPVPSPDGSQGVVGHIVLGGDTTLDVEFLYDADYNIAYEAKTNKFAGYQMGLGVMISFPSLYIDDTPERTAEGATGAKVRFHATENATTTTDLLASRFAIHRFPT